MYYGNVGCFCIGDWKISRLNLLLVDPIKVLNSNESPRNYSQFQGLNLTLVTNSNYLDCFKQRKICLVQSEYFISLVRGNQKNSTNLNFLSPQFSVIIRINTEILGCLYYWTNQFTYNEQTTTKLITPLATSQYLFTCLLGSHRLFVHLQD